MALVIGHMMIDDTRRTTEVIESGYGARTVIITVPARPIYQTKANIDHEKEFCAAITMFSNYSIKRIRKKLYPCDMVLLDQGKVIAFLEFKHRFNALEHGNGVMLSLEKISRLIIFATVSKLPVLFAIENTERQYYVAEVKLDRSHPYAVQHGGRKDRGDAADMEPVILVPRGEFKPLNFFLREMREVKE